MTDQTQVDISKRKSIASMAKGVLFVAPVVTSISMGSALINEAKAYAPTGGRSRPGRAGRGRANIPKRQAHKSWWKKFRS